MEQSLAAAPSPATSAALSATAPTRRVVLHRPERTGPYARNRVSNTKYSLASFLPLVLRSQFQSLMNVYFLLVSVLQLWPTLTPVNPLTSWVPFLTVLAISALKEALDDLRRHRADQEANARVVSVLQGRAFAPLRSEDIQVGHIVRVLEGEEVPCDLCLLRTSQVPAGTECEILTANLDGETDLKPRHALHATAALRDAEFVDLDAVLDTEAPNADPNRFEARIRLPSAPEARTGSRVDQHPSVLLAVGPEQFIPQGCVLRHTRWIVGVAVCTFSETAPLFPISLLSPPSFNPVPPHTPLFDLVGPQPLSSSTLPRVPRVPRVPRQTRVRIRSWPGANVGPRTSAPPWTMR